MVFRLPYHFVMPRALFNNELLSLTSEEKSRLLARGLELGDLDGDGVARARRAFNQHRALNLNDCFALALAESFDDAILLTGDQPLREVASGQGVEVHGVLWAIDELGGLPEVSPQMLHEALSIFLEDELVFLPAEEIRRRLRRLTLGR